MAGSREIVVKYEGDASDLERASRDASHAVEGVGRSTDELGEKFGDNASKSAQLAGAMGDLGGALSQAGGPLGTLGTGMELLGPSIMGVTGVMDLAELATGAWSKATWLLNAAMDAMPIILIVAGIVALIAVIILAYQHSDTFRQIVQNAWAVVQAVISFAWNNVIEPIFELWLLQFRLAWQAAQFLAGIVADAFGAIGRGISAAWGVVSGVFDTIVSEFAKLPGRLASAAAGLWDFLWQGFKTAINTVIGWWNDFEISIGPISIPFAPDIPKITIGTPNIPKLAAGGIVTRATLALIGERGPEAVIPLSRLGGGGATFVQLDVHVPPTANPAETGRAVAGALRSYFAAGGRLAVPA